MNVVKRLTLSFLKHNSKRTIGTIVGIMLSSGLICAFGGLIGSFHNTLIKNAVNQTGYYHVLISQADEERFNTAKANRYVKEIVKMYDHGLRDPISDGSIPEEYDHAGAVNLYSFDDINDVNRFGYTLIEGRLPDNDREVVVSDFLTRFEDYSIGDTIVLGEEKNTYTITGVLGAPGSSYMNSYMCAFTTGYPCDRFDLYITLNNIRQYNLKIDSILGVDTTDDEYGYRYIRGYDKYGFAYLKNQELLRWEGFNFSDDLFGAMVFVSAIVITIIMVTSVFCIRNSFAISTSEKLKIYGMLSSVGATKRQIRSSVRLEALILGLVGIPLGLLLGTFATFVLVEITNLLLVNIVVYDDFKFCFKVPVWAYFVSTVLGFVTIYLSSLSSAMRAGKVSPIDNLRGTNEIKLTNNKLKVPVVISKLFGVGGELAYKNLKRSGRKYRTTVISLVVSVFVFISLTYFIDTAFDFSDEKVNLKKYNMTIYNPYSYGSEEYYEFIDYLSRDADIKKVYTTLGYDAFMVIEDEELVVANENISRNEYGLLFKTVYLDEATFDEYCSLIGVNPDSMSSKVILNDTCKTADNDKKKKITTLMEGDTLNVIWYDTVYNGSYDGDEPEGFEEWTEIVIPESIVIGAVTKKEFIFSTGYTPTVYFCRDDLDYTGTTQHYILSGKPNTTEERIKEKYDCSVDNLLEEYNQMRRLRITIDIFLYGFLIVITLIGVTNIFNTITSNMELRSREFASLKSIGMTRHEFNRMVNLETLFYSIRALMIGIVLGILTTLLLYYGFSLGADDLGYEFPIKAVLIAIVAVILIVWMIMRYSISRINRQNTIETIRKENI
mgnify:CR=1 FL=1